MTSTFFKSMIVAVAIFPLNAWGQDGTLSMPASEYRPSIAMSTGTIDPMFDMSLRLSLAHAPEEVAATEQADASGDDLVKKLQNPVANLISIPLQFNFDTGFGPKKSDRVVLNVQPVIPVTLNEDWNVIIRTIIPVIYQESVATGVNSESGMGDVVQSFFFSPKEPVHGLIIGFGPVFLWPTATDDSLGGEKWGVGPTFLALKQESGWTYGFLFNHLWSYAGNDDRKDVNATFIQPFISYTFPTHTTLGFNTESTYDWTNEAWLVPLNISVSQLVKIGGLPLQFAIGGRYYLEAPDGGPEWGIRFTITLLFPK